MADDHLISLQPGTVIGGKYEVVKCLGSGSMGLVYACRHRELQGHMVAIKVLFPEVAQDKVSEQRFKNEIFASYNVSHPNVVRAYDILRDGELVAYTMEYVGGGDLAERLSRQDRMPIPEVIRLLSQMAAGVQAIHDAGIVHRDLKPENILLTKEGNVKIADFGIARNRHGPKLTEHGGVVGTIDYVAPEYMLRAQVDWRSDVYAIGILAYEMITGESPFKGDSVYATMTKRLKTDPELPSKLRPDCPQPLDKVILKAMHRDPQQRYQSAMEIFFDLQRIASEQGMRTALTGGLFLPNQGAIPNYVGPSVSTGQEDGAPVLAEDFGGMHESAVNRPAARMAAGPQGSLASAWDESAALNNVGNGGVTARANPAPVDREDESGGTTKVLGNDLVGFVSDISTTESPHAKLEQVLGNPGDLVSDGWGSQEDMQVPTGMISNRVRDLTYRYHEQNARRSYMLDIIGIVVAMIVGIGFGCVVMKLFFPSFFAGLTLFKG